MLAQLEAQQTLPSIAVSIVAEVSGYKCTMTCPFGVWDRYDLTHQFLDDRCTSIYGPGNHTSFEQEATLPMAPCAPVQPAAPHLLPPAHMLIQLQPQPQSQPPSYPLHPQQLVPTLTQTAPITHTPYASAPALRAPRMMLQAAVQPASLELAGSCQVSSAKVQSVQSSAPPSVRPLMAPSMANRTPSEQAVIQAPQTVANYPESTLWKRCRVLYLVCKHCWTSICSPRAAC